MRPNKANLVQKLYIIITITDYTPQQQSYVRTKPSSMHPAGVGAKGKAGNGPAKEEQDG